MNDKQFMILGITAAALFVLVVVFYSGIKFGGDSFKSGGSLIQGIDTAKINSIKISDKKGAFTLNRVDDSFVIAEKHNYPASNKKINDLIIKALEIKLSEKISSNSDYFKELGVADDSEEAVKVEFNNSEGKLITGFIKGKSLERGGGAYIRLIGGDSVFSTSDNLTILTEQTDFMEKELFNIDSKDVIKAVVTLPNEQYTITREGEGDDTKLVLSTVPKGRNADDDLLEDTIGALSGIDFDDVLPASDKNLNFDSAFLCELKSGLQYQVYSAIDGEDHYISLRAISPVRSQISISEEENEEQLKEKESLLLANDKANSFNKLHQGWIYKVSKYQAEEIRKQSKYLLEEEEEEEKEETE